MYPTRRKAVESDIATYEGTVEFGKLTGEGKLIGDVPQDFVDQRITIWKSDKSKNSFQCRFVNNQLDGRGYYFADNKLTFEGNFLKGKVIGEGLFYLKCGHALWVDINEMKGEFTAKFFNIDDGKLLFNGTFYKDELLRGIFYNKDKPYELNEYLEVVIEGKTYKSEPNFDFDIIIKLSSKCQLIIDRGKLMVG